MSLWRTKTRYIAGGFVNWFNHFGKLLGNNAKHMSALQPSNSMPVFFLFILFYFWLRWVFVAACRLSLVAASGGYSSLRCTGFSLQWLLLLWTTGSRHTGSVIVAHRPSCSVACGIFPDQGSSPCPLHWQTDS